MPTPTYDLIASNVLTSATATVTFSSISGGYRDLVLVCQPIHATLAESSLRLRFNSSSTGYSFVIAVGTGNTEISESGTGTEINLSPYAQITTSQDSSQIVQIMDYSTNKHKIALVRADRAAGSTEMQAHRWASTSAITSLELFAGSGNLNTGSSFHLYGIVS
jgi:hypothetical protein